MNEAQKDVLREQHILAPITGTAVPLEQVPDPVFSQKICNFTSCPFFAAANVFNQTARKKEPVVIFCSHIQPRFQ